MKKKAFVTGATGFVGANLVRRLLEDGFEVHLTARKTSDKWRIREVLSRVSEHELDLLDAGAVRTLLSEIKPDVIFNLAIYGGYPAQSDPKRILDTNFTGAVNLLDACDGFDYDCFVQVGSSSEYGPKSEKMREDMLLEPINAYGVAKAAATLYAQFIAKTRDKPVVVVRPFSPFGFFEEPTRLVPSLIKSCMDGKNPELGSPSAVRDFVFVEDLVEALMLVINSPGKVKGEVLNVGMGEQVSIEEMARMVISLTDPNLKPEFGAVKPRSYDTEVWMADISKIKKLLGWEPKTGVKEGLKKTVDWFTKNKALYA